MADAYLHGVRVLEVSDSSHTIKSISTAIIGLVCTADDADTSVFPLNKAVLFTNPAKAVASAGSKGTLKKSLTAIADMVTTPVVVVRVAHAKDETELTANIIGEYTNDGKNTGMKALLSAQSEVGVKPRILGVPYLDSLNVAVQLAAIAKKLNAFAYVSAYGCSTKEEVANYRKNFSQRELMIIHGDWYATDSSGATAEDSAVARALGLRAYLDKTVGWHKNLSNVAIDVVSGITKVVDFDIQNESTDANYLNEKGVTVLINFNGFRYWGSRTCSDDDNFAFEQYTRTAQIIRDTIAEAYAWAIDKPLSVALVKEMVEMIRRKMAYWKASGYIIDGNAWVDATINTTDEIKSGKFTIDYDFTPVPSLENLNLRQRITDSYLVDFANQLASV